jgi:NAD(P)H-dependent FMN reductase
MNFVTPVPVSTPASASTPVSGSEPTVAAVTATVPAPARGAVTATVPAPARAAAPPVRLAVVIGSNRAGRFGPVVGDWLLSRVRLRADLVVDVIDMAENDLPTALAHQPSPEVADRLAKVSPKLATADAFIAITPEYNHSYPASLKSLIDWHFTEWQAKPVALVSYGGMAGGLRAVEHLRQVFAELHAVTIRETLSFSHAHSQFDDEGRLREPGPAQEAAERMLDQLVWWAEALRTAKQERPYAA